MGGTGGRLRGRLSLASRRELTQNLAERYAKSTRNQKQQILEEFSKLTGLHRKHAIRVLNQTARELAAGLERIPGNRVHNEAVREALVVLWEAADRICGKRLKQIAPVLLDSVHRHWHLQLGSGGSIATSRHQRSYHGCGPFGIEANLIAAWNSVSTASRKNIAFTSNQAP
jgi:hypothetical protein